MSDDISAQVEQAQTTPAWNRNEPLPSDNASDGSAGPPRWWEDPPPKEDPRGVGKEGIEKDAGFEPMPERKKRDETFNSDRFGLRAAAHELGERRIEAVKAPPVERSYLDSRDGRPIPDNQTISAERAARDLTDVRKAENAVVEDADVEKIASEVDALRRAELGEPVAQPETPLEPQPEAPAADPSETQLQRLLRTDPSFRSEIETLVSSTQAQQQNLQSAYQLALNQAAYVQHAALVTDYPDLANLQGPQMEGALQAMSRQNPQRAAAFVQRANQIQQVVTHAQQQQAAQQQQQQAQRAQQWDHWSRAQDAEFDKAVAHEPVFKEIQQKLPGWLQEHYGISGDALAHAWQTIPEFRQASTQRLLYDLGKFLHSKEGMRRAPVDAPRVMKPGMAQPRATDADLRNAAVTRNFKEAPSLQTAAKLLAARRAARGR